MKRHIRIFLAGVLVVVPFAITAYVIWWLASWLGKVGYGLAQKLGIVQAFGGEPAGGSGLSIREIEDMLRHVQATQPAAQDALNLGSILAAFLGVVIVLAGIYLVGLLTHSWIFRRALTIIENWISHVPGVKTIYESVRDLMKLFGGDSARMGRAVLYKIPQSDISVLGILTNESPTGINGDGREELVALYLPFSYMFGGPTIYVSRKHVQETGMSVDQALKLCATAHVSGQAMTNTTDMSPASPIPAVTDKPVH